MFQLDFRDRRPLYEQIKERMKTFILSGVLKSDERIPSVRELAQSLTINPNTIQKAYKELEDEGYIYSIRGKGNFVVPQDLVVNQKKLNDLEQEMKKILKEMLYLGIGKERILSLINDIYSERTVKDEND
ncbi:GntR family transcriptional regulator [Petroclostridium sp. X23]|uniref:GntR family transcriptional regulator n=1 Tax=Petroclostridium sp. X23 TaxID=3045146 RepID=UPI0024ACAF39|nr:GntR family transcriptional regulator [Petroclostridium sp. X23]WHH58867.1 GntR family transcriptional regulator [Petroclostridium sp. X23]